MNFKRREILTKFESILRLEVELTQVVGEIMAAHSFFPSGSLLSLLRLI